MIAGTEMNIHSSFGVSRRLLFLILRYVSVLSGRNKKNRYLLAGKIRCMCGRTRSGEGPLKGKHLYYRCTDRVLRFPLPRECRERGLNARIADELVWQQIVQLMSSPQLMREQVERRMNSDQATPTRPAEDIAAIEREVEKLKEQASRYNAAYGAGVFTLEQLRECVMPLNDKIKGLEAPDYRDTAAKAGHGGRRAAYRRRYRAIRELSSTKAS